MSIFSFRKKAQIQGPTFNPSLFMPISWADQFLSFSGKDNEKKFMEYYLSVPELQSIVNYRAKCKASGKIKLRKIEGEDVKT